ncbi:MAG: Asp-tRNA(Asn)/Glu-tRNA(Gln) amidotransferase subunit GatC [Candidatus Moranbacteria bacterium]|nr:Asp-tRNA(Asn)/Glu-tRNA(Gln) amidotransferase subunit GatC [Candidatus Moranbacteria bacterium]
MAQISKQTVRQVAKLGRISVNEEELEKYTQELQGILEFIKILEQIDVSGYEPLLNSTDQEDIFFEDKPNKCLNTDEIIANFPTRQGNYLKTKPVLK